MHLDQTTHEHGVNARVYAYEADYEMDGDTVRWSARVRRGDEAPRQFDGSIPIGSPAASVIAEQAVRDAIVTRIDGLDVDA